MSSMQVSSGRPHMLTSNQRGRGNDPVTVLGRIRSAVAVNMAPPDGNRRLRLRCGGYFRHGALLQRHNLPGFVTRVDLAWTGDLLFGVLNQFLPLSQPAYGARNGKQHG